MGPSGGVLCFLILSIYRKRTVVIAEVEREGED